VGEEATDHTVSPESAPTHVSRPVPTFHNRTVPSSDPETMRFPSGLKPNAVTARVWPSNVRTTLQLSLSTS